MLVLITNGCIYTDTITQAGFILILLPKRLIHTTCTCELAITQASFILILLSKRLIHATGACEITITQAGFILILLSKRLTHTTGNILWTIDTAEATPGPSGRAVNQPFGGVGPGAVAFSDLITQTRKI